MKSAIGTTMRLPDQRIVVGSIEEHGPPLLPEGKGMVVGSERSVELAQPIVGAGVAIYSGSRSHNPEESVAEATSVADSARPAWILGIGSSSAIDLAKAVNSRVGLNLLAIPTTLGGSEMSRFYGSRTRTREKGGGSGKRLLPTTVIYDPELLASLELEWLAASGMNALGHAIEAHYARTENWLGSVAAADAGASLASLLVRCGDGRDRALHVELFRAACLAGFAMNSNGMGLHHAICHVLGGITGVAHAHLNAAVLPSAVATNQALASERVQRTLIQMGVGDFRTTAQRIAETCGTPLSLRELGVIPEQIELAVDPVMKAHHLRNNPAKLTEAEVRACMERAYENGP